MRAHEFITSGFCYDCHLLHGGLGAVRQLRVLVGRRLLRKVIHRGLCDASMRVCGIHLSSCARSGVRSEMVPARIPDVRTSIKASAVIILHCPLYSYLLLAAAGAHWCSLSSMQDQGSIIST